MPRCPYLEYKDTGWFSYDHFCKLTGAKVGDENNKVKVEHLCDTSDYDTCPVYKDR